MNCHKYVDALDEHLNGARHPAFEAHLGECAACRALVADFERLRTGVSALEEHIPPPRVWARIAAGIEQDRGSWWTPLLAWPIRPGVPAAATLALLVGTALWFDWHAAVPGPADVLSLGADGGEVLPEQQYEDAIAGLQQMADAQGDALDPATRQVLRQSLAAIDRAISESRDALSTDPANAFAHESLLDALDTKVALLQDTVTLAGDLAGGTADAAPDTPGELNQ